MTNLLTPPFAALVALLPAVLAAWWGYRLGRSADDSVLPERLMAMRRRNGMVIGCCIALLYSLASPHSWWAIPLLAITRMIAGYRVRKMLYRDTWSLFGYCSFFARLVVALFGFWVLLSMTPSIASIAGVYDWIVGALLGVALAIGNENYTSVFRVVMRARPVQDEMIRARFAAMVAACELPDVALHVVDTRGGTFVNAVALPSIRKPAVAVTNTLLERLDAEETVAVLAHELAHLEHYNPRRLRQLNTMTYVMLAVAALLVPGARLAGGAPLYGLFWLWQVALIVVMMQRARDRQKNETASDLRAIALCGNADSLAVALTKIHVAGRIPRRWDAEWERHASHPSLARRIQAIHEAAGMPPISLAEPVSFVAADNSAIVTFHADRVAWADQAESSHSILYSHLTTLRVDARGANGARIVAVDTSQRRWECPMRGEDVARAQATLDMIDTRLGAAIPPPVVPLILPRVLALMAVVACLSLQQLPAAVVVAAVGLLPSLPVIGAAGGASVAVASLLLRDSTLLVSDWRPWFALALFVCGAAFIVVSVMNRREPTPRLAERCVWVLAGATVVALLGLGLSSGSAMDLYRGARAWPSAVILALALGGAFAFTRSRAVRYSSAILVTAGAATVFAGSTGFRNTFVHDPFLADAGWLAERRISTHRVAEFQVPFNVNTLWVSPHGTHIALTAEDDEENVTLHAGVAGGALVGFDADEAAFVDDTRLLVLERREDASILRLVDLDDAPRTTRSWRLPTMYGELTYDTVARSWHVAGRTDDELITVSGSISKGEVLEKRWDMPADEDGWVFPVAVSRGHLLALERRYAAASPGSGLRDAVKRFMLPPQHDWHRLVRVGDDGSQPLPESRLDLTCATVAEEGRATTCAAYDGTTSHVFAVDAASGRATPAGSVPGHLHLYNHAGDGWAMGTLETEPVLVRAATREGLRVADAIRDDAYEIAVGDRVVATAAASNDRTTVRIYSR